MSGDLDTSQTPVLEKAAAGYSTTVTTQLVRVLCKLGSILIMARLVAPAGYGDFAMAASVFLFLGIFRDGGLGTAAVQAGKLTSRQMNSLFWSHLGLGLALAAMTWLVAPLASVWYQSESVTALIRTMGATFVIIGAGGFMRAQLYREMRVDRANRNEAIGAVVGTVTMIGAGLQGAEAYSFVVFLVVTELVATLLAWRENTWRPKGAWSLGELRPLWQVGRNVTLNHCLAYLATHLDAIAIGRWFGAGAVGLYTRTGQLLTLPTNFITVPFGQVMLTTLSRLRKSAQPMDQHAWKMVTSVSHLALPCYTVCAVLPEPVIRILLGTDWLDAVPLLRVLAIGGAMTCLTSIAQTLNIASQNSRRLLGAAIINIAAIVIAILVGRPFGLEGIATAIALAQVAVVYPRLWWLLREVPQGTSQYLKAMVGPALVSAVYGGGLWIAHSLASASALHPGLHAGALVAAGAGSAGLLILVSPQIRRELMDTLAIVRGKVQPPSPASSSGR